MLLSLLPALIVLVLGITTHRVILSLFFGLLFAGLLATDFSPYETFSLLIHQLWSNLEFEKWHSWQSLRGASKIFVIGFVLFSSILFHLMKESKGTFAIMKKLRSRVNDRKSAETTSMLLSHCLFIDGMLSSMTVSSLMRPLSKKYLIPKAKIAFLADSLASPLTVICPISCFTALLIGLLASHGVEGTVSSTTILHASPNIVYLLSIPFCFYSLTLVPSVWLIVRKRLAFSQMKELERTAKEENITSTDLALDSVSIWDFIFPASSFLYFIISLAFIFSEGNQIGNAIQTTPVSLVLCLASLFSLLATSIFYLFRGVFSPAQLSRITIKSVKEVSGSIVVIFFAWSLASILRNQLNLGSEISRIFSTMIPIETLPLLFFWMASLISLSLGTSWGTIAIFIPIATPIVLHMLHLELPVTLESANLLFPVIGAIISGSVFGDHTSMLSDSTVLASSGSGCPLIDHVKTQWSYVVPIFLATSGAFLAAGFTPEMPTPFNFVLPLFLSIMLSFSSLYYLHAKEVKREKEKI